ncbi:MAG: serine/threonine-protein kinase [Candidatus Xenobia bacterium]
MRWLLLLCLLTTAVAGAQEVDLGTIPAGAVVLDVDRRQVVATAQAPRFIATVSGLHHYRLQDSPFDSLDLTVRWSPEIGRWHFQAGLQEGYLPYDFELSRTVHLNVVPADAVVYQEAPSLANPSAIHNNEVVLISGLPPRAVVPLARSADGAVMIPHASSSCIVYLKAPGFEDWSYQFKPGALAGKGPFPATPIRLRALYGPFSYGFFNLGLAGAGVGAILVWLLWLRPVQRRQAGLLQRERQVREAVQLARQSTPDSLLLDRVITTDSGERFTLLRFLGRGGMAVVYEAMPAADSPRDPRERWAAKILLDANWGNPAFRERFIREVRICSRLQHSSIVKVLDWGVEELSIDGADPEEHAFMIMELLDGTSLEALFPRAAETPFDTAQAVRWMGLTLEALAAAHRAGVIHRDLKPSNLFITASGNVKLIDFGIARDRSAPTLTPSYAQMGTPGYMSPEQIDNSKAVTVQSDIYSAGVMFYRMLSGRLPFDSENMWAMFTHMLTQDPPNVCSLNPGLPEPLGALVMRMIARDPDARFQCATEVLEALHACTPS